EADQILHEVVMPEGPADFAVGDDVEADRFLHPDDVANGLVLDRLQFFGGDRFFGEALAGVLDGFGAKERADVIGPVGWGRHSLSCLVMQSAPCACRSAGLGHSDPDCAIYTPQAGSVQSNRPIIGCRVERAATSRGTGSFQPLGAWRRPRARE